MGDALVRRPGCTRMRQTVVVFDDALFDDGLRQTTGDALTEAGYEVLGLFWSPHEFDRFLRKQQVGDVDMIGTVHTYPYDGQQLAVLHEPGGLPLGDRYLQTLFPISAPIIIRGMNIKEKARVAIVGTDAIDDPLVWVMDQFDAVYGHGRTPSGPFAFFHAEDFQKGALRWYRGGEKPRLIRVTRDAAEPHRQWKLGLRSMATISRLIDRGYYYIPKWVRRRWGGDLTRLDALDVNSGERISGILRRQTTIVKDWVRIFKAMEGIPKVDPRYRLFDPNEPLPPGRRHKILIGDDNKEHLRTRNFVGLEDYDLTVRQTAAELVRQILYNETMRRDKPSLMFRLVLTDMEMPARVVREELRPRKRRDSIATPYFYPIGLVIAACARKLGYRVGVLTFAEHHRSPVVSLLGNGGTLRGYELVGSQGIMVCSAQYNCTVEDVCVVERKALGVRAQRYYRYSEIGPTDQLVSPAEQALRAKFPSERLARLFSLRTNRRVGVVLAKSAKRIKAWGELARMLEGSPDPDAESAESTETTCAE